MPGVTLCARSVTHCAAATTSEALLRTPMMTPGLAFCGIALLV